jgi:hypothetical protein
MAEITHSINHKKKQNIKPRYRDHEVARKELKQAKTSAFARTTTSRTV